MSEEAPRRVLPRTGYPRRKAVTACQVCRERKRRCDNGRPSCSFCQKIGVTCQYPGRDESSYDAGSLAILDRLSVLETLMRSQGSAAATSPSSTLSHTTDAERGRQPAISEYQSNVWELGSGARAGLRTDKILQWPVFTDALSSLPRFPFLNARKEDDYTYLTDGMYQPQGLDARSPPSQMPSFASPASVSTEREDVEPLVDRFFTHVHTKNPILDRQTVRQYCQEYYEHGLLFNLQTCLILLISALGWIAPDFDPGEPLSEEVAQSSCLANRSEPLRMAKCYFAAAEKRLSAAISRPSSLGVQCLCLAGIYHMYTIDAMAAQAMFHAAGYALQVLIATGADSLEGESQLGSSLFWACSKSEGEILAEVPITVPALRGQGQSSGYPLPSQKRFMGSSSDASTQVEEESWYFLLSEIAMRRISDKIAEAVDNWFEKIPQVPEQQQQSAAEEFIPLALELERQTNAWREHLPSRFQFPDAPERAPTEGRLHLRSQYYRALELVHRPFVYVAIHQSNPSPMILMLASKGLASASDYLHHGNSTHWHHGRWLQLRHELKETCLLLAASGSGIEMPDGWREAVCLSLRTLRYWRPQAPLLQPHIDVVLVLQAYFGFHDEGAGQYSEMTM